VWIRRMRLIVIMRRSGCDFTYTTIYSGYETPKLLAMCNEISIILYFGIFWRLIVSLL